MLLLAHRGASADAPENTLPAFEEAISQRADGVELDVMVCGSGELVVCHDEKLDRLAGVGWEVGRTPYEALARLDVGTRLGFPPARIPRLEEVLELLPSRFLVNIELKCDRVEDRGLSEKVARLVRARRLEGRVVVSSFNPVCLMRLGAAAPEVRRGFLLDPDRPFLLQDALLTPLCASYSVHPFHEAVTPARVDRWHARGWRVAVWTVDEPLRAKELRALGVDMCITNRPRALRAALEG
ncbi:MAG: glycerophosphodiester phosphodiesterase [Myxococcaceae bacterium]|nr:glycerophosphodiester phosphodiesterase [Myxococcaceae bacterium]MCI0670975.1 glycerophosphodiester phosphodiesterase [Myxococcaceae bacterium]